MKEDERQAAIYIGFSGEYLNECACHSRGYVLGFNESKQQHAQDGNDSNVRFYEIHSSLSHLVLPLADGRLLLFSRLAADKSSRNRAKTGFVTELSWLADSDHEGKIVSVINIDVLLLNNKIKQ